MTRAAIPQPTRFERAAGMSTAHLGDELPGRIWHPKAQLPGWPCADDCTHPDHRHGDKELLLGPSPAEDATLPCVAASLNSRPASVTGADPRRLPWPPAARIILTVSLGIWCVGWAGFILWTLLAP